jgi:arylsulfatase A-like enzyme
VSQNPLGRCVNRPGLNGLAARLEAICAAGRASLVVALAAALCSCSAGPIAEGPNVLLVVLDTTRSDRLSLYGYERETTPNLERLAASSTVYDTAYATSTWTAPSHASLFTGLYPHGHGVTQMAWDLPAAQETLAELLRDAGYDTVGIVGNPMVGRRLGFDQGFDEYYETWEESAAGEGTHPAVRHLERFLDNRGSRPFLAFVNLIEPHSPYDSGKTYRGEFVAEDPPALEQNHWRAYYRGRKTFSDRELRHLGDLYDAELRYADELVGRLVALLEERRLLDETVLVVTSDHGENLGDHGMLDHVFSLYETTVRIPLLVRFPGVFEPGRRVSAPVQLVDLFPTLLGLAGVERAGGHGIDLRGPVPADDRPVLLSYDYPRQAFVALGRGAHHPALAEYKRRLFALRLHDLKLIVGDDGHLEFYDLAADPAERNDLAAAGDARLPELLKRTRTLLIEPSGVGPERAAPGPEQDAETLERLRSLGYAE